MSAAAKNFRPNLETLEDRQLMAVKVGFDTSQTVLYLTGDSKANRIEIFDDGSGGVGNIYGTVDGKNLFQYTSDKAIRTIVINTGKGNDSVTFRAEPIDPGRNLLGTMAVMANLGSGHDSFSWSLTGSILNATFYDFSVVGGTGNDVITGDATATDLIFSSRLNFDARGEAGRDVIRFVQDGYLGQSNRITFAGDGGRDNDVVSATSNVQDFSLGRIYLDVLGGLGFDKLDLISSAARPEDRTLAFATLDGGVDSRPGYRDLNPRQWEDITVSSNVILRNVDPRSRISTIIV